MNQSDPRWLTQAEQLKSNLILEKKFEKNVQIGHEQ